MGAYGNLESINLIVEKRQAFINFIEAGDAYRLMASLGGELQLGGRPLLMTWARTRPVPRDLWSAIRQGATRNLYVANVPESFTEAHVLSMFGPFGELESVRLAQRKQVRSCHGLPRPSPAFSCLL